MKKNDGKQKKRKRTVFTSASMRKIDGEEKKRNKTVFTSASMTKIDGKEKNKENSFRKCIYDRVLSES